MKFTGQMLGGAILMTATILGGMYSMMSGVRESQLKTESDVRDLSTRFELRDRADAERAAQQVEVERAKAEARAAEQKAAAAALDDLRRLTTLLTLQYQQLQKGQQ